MNASTSTGKSGEDMVYNIEDKLPRILSAINAQAPAAAKAQLAADQAYNPGFMQLQTDLYRTYGPQLNQIGNELARGDAMYNAQTDLDLQRGVGGDNARMALALQRELDPNFYATQDLAGAKQRDLLNAVDPSRLTRGELENQARGLGRTGQTFLPGGLSAAASAQNFGNALGQKQDRFSQYLAQAQQGLSSLRSGLSGFDIATKRPGTNTGANLFTGVQQGSGDQAYNTGNNFMSGVFGNQQKQYESALGKSGSVMGMAGKGIGAIASAI